MIPLLRELYRSFSVASRRRLKLALVGMLIVTALEMTGLVLVLPLIQMLTADDGRTGMVATISGWLGDPSDSALVTILAGAVFCAFLVKALFTLAFQWWLLGFTNREAADASTQLFERYLRAPYSLHLERNTAEFLRTLSMSVKQAYLTVVNGILTTVSELTTVAGVLLVLLATRPIPAIGAFFYFALAGMVFVRGVRRSAVHAGDELMSAARETNKIALQAFGAIKAVQVQNVQQSFVDDYRRHRMRETKAQRTSLFLSNAPKHALEVVFIVGVAVMSIAVFASSDAPEAAATLGLFVAAGFRMLPSMVRSLAAISSVRVGEKGLRLVLDDFSALPPIGDHSAVVAPADLREALTLEQVEFRYPSNDSNVLDHFDLVLPAGTSLAIVGSSGAGKSTLVDIVLGLHEPTAGRVLVDGVELGTIREAWQRTIGLVPQDVYLLDASLRANIAFGARPEEIDEERILEAVERAQLHELVAQMPQGLDTFVGERGTRISGGQRQRVGIARALYQRPQLLILDEATSSLDNETEHKITTTIDALQGDLTMIIVAHRLSTVRRCDQLIFMRDGKIETQGTFAEVAAQNATFARLVELGSLDALDAAAGDPALAAEPGGAP